MKLCYVCIIFLIVAYDSILWEFPYWPCMMLHPSFPRQPCCIMKSSWTSRHDAILVLHSLFNNLVRCYSMWLNYFCIMFMITMCDTLLCVTGKTGYDDTPFLCYFPIYHFAICLPHILIKHLWHYNRSVTNLWYPHSTQNDVYIITLMTTYDSTLSSPW